MSPHPDRSAPTITPLTQRGFGPGAPHQRRYEHRSASALSGSPPPYGEGEMEAPWDRGHQRWDS